MSDTNLPTIRKKVFMRLRPKASRPMAHTYLIDPKLRCIFVRYWDRVDAKELGQVRREIEADPDFGPGMNRVWDERDCTIDISHEDLARLAGIWAQSSANHGPRKLAYLVKDDLSWGFNRVFEAYRNNPELTYKLFRDYDEAKAWLGLPGHLPDPRILMASS